LTGGLADWKTNPNWSIGQSANRSIKKIFYILKTKEEGADI